MEWLEAYLAGMITTGFLIAGLFFARFWFRTGDSLFAAFAGAFWLLAINQALLMLTGVLHEEETWTYLLRLAAFALISAAVVHKNSGRRPDHQ
jgi:hypothetical membrane protein